VIAGALLALAVEEWRDTRHQHERTRKALISIRDELMLNVDLVSKSRERNAFLRDTLSRLAELNKLPDPGIYTRAMLNRAGVMHAAWQLAVQTGSLSDVPLEVLLPIAKAYDAQTWYGASGDAVANAILNDTRQFGMEGMLRDRFRQYIPLAIDGYNYEKYLLERYDLALGRLSPLIK
jgi:hypothetical protein